MKKFILLIAEKTTYSTRIQSQLQEYEVCQCTTLSESVVLCKRHHITLVLVDEEISGYSGCMIFKKLRGQCPSVSGLLLTGTEETQVLRQAIDAGISGLVELPLEKEKLNHQVAIAMESALLREENMRLHTLLPLYSLGEQFLAATEEQEVLDNLLDEVVKQTGSRRVSVMLYDKEEACLRITAARGMERDLIESIRIKPGDQIAGWVFEQGKPVILNRDTQQESIFAPLLKRAEIVSAISFPLILRGNVLGVLNINRTTEDDFFSESDKEMLAIICGQAALALENVFSQEVAKKTTRMRTLFEQYVAPEVAEILLASDADILGVGAVKEVTVLFADIRNFTRLVQRMELSELRTFLNEFFQIFTDTIFQNQGTVDKFMGDAVLAVFGAPVELENANLTAVQTALVIRERFEALRLRWSEQCKEFQGVDLGIAVTCGQVFLGNVGSARRLDYTMIGTPVNIAQRLAAESFQCRIYVTESVRQAICKEKRTDEIGKVSLRGVEQRVKVFSVEPEKNIIQ